MSCFCLSDLTSLFCFNDDFMHLLEEGLLWLASVFVMLVLMKSSWRLCNGRTPVAWAGLAISRPSKHTWRPLDFFPLR